MRACGRVAIVVLLFVVAGLVQGGPYDLGGSVTGEFVLPPGDRPYEVRSDIFVESDARFVIQAGAEIRFSPGTGVTVRPNGILIAQGEPGRKIVFTRLLQQPWAYSPQEGVASWPEVRLVDGDSILEGRLQMRYNDRWRSVCSNSKNWTEADLHVLCRQLGFAGGVHSHWFERNNDTSQMLYEKPHCYGDEEKLSDCPNWNSRQIGSGVCDYHEDLGVRCEGNLGNHSEYHWRGLQFNNAKAEQDRPIVNKVVQLASLSLLQHVDILYAGSDFQGNVTPALEVLGIPPRMNFLEVKYSAFDGIHLIRPLDAFELKDSVVAENRGFGLFVNSSVPKITLSRTNVRDNGGDGVFYVYHESYLTGLPFCDTGNIRDQQIYPLRRQIVQEKSQSFVRGCEQVFEVASWTNQVLTVNLIGLNSDAEDERYAARFEVYDGPTDSSRLLASIPILSNTFPQSIRSTRHKVLLRYRPAINHYVSFTVEIVANSGRAYDLNLTDCNITDNFGRGVLIRNQRSGILVNRTRLVRNGYLAGLDVSGGAGDVLVNNSHVTSNIGDGINITSAGGYLHVDLTSIANNTGRGISFWFNESSNCVSFNHTVHITRSEIVHNSLYGILIGNQCQSDSFWNISMNSFRGNLDTALLFLSCWRIKGSETNVSITHNQFKASRFLAIEIAPIFHANVLIEHNEIRWHERGAIWVNSLDQDVFDQVPSLVEIQNNYLTGNSGTFIVNIGMFQGNNNQRLLFTKNRLEENFVEEPFPFLKPRSRVAAVVVVSSDNTDVYRNAFYNSQSSYELGSHLEIHNAVINATYNFWGTTRTKQVFERIFDRKDRYNLASVEFLPFLLGSSDLDTISAISEYNERDKIIPFRDGAEIGGEIPGVQTLEAGTYNVRRDIYIRPGGRLEIQPGAELRFERSVGMMVQGTLLSESKSVTTPITYTLLKGSETGSGTSNLRLSNGTEGRLEVLVEGRWGSVCYQGWDIVAAAVACHQIGLVLHPEDWMLEQSEFAHGSNPNFVLSNVQCSLLDTDITLCKSEKDFENSCSTQVGLRCHLPSWSGLRFGMSAEESRLENIIVEQAGLLDYSTNRFKPALQIDFNRHVLRNLVIRQNSDSGLGVLWNEMFVSENRKVEDSLFTSNQRHGIVVHAQGFNILHCKITENGESGVHYNPMFSRIEQRDLMTWVNLQDRSSVVVIPEDNREEIFIGPGDRRLLIFSKKNGDKTFRIQTNAGRSLGIMILNPFAEASTESMIIYGRFAIADDVIQWDLRKNLTSFPLKTPGYGVSVRYRSGSNPSGKAIIYIASVDGQRSRSATENHPMLQIDSSEIHRCKRGFSSHHFNRDIGIYGEHFHRYSNETIMLYNTTISGSKAEAIFVWTPFWDPTIRTLAEVNYTIKNCVIKENTRTLLHYSRDIRNSNNLFHWTINSTELTSNANGGIDIRLPYVWQYDENFTHSFIMHNSTLTRNRNFEFSIDGHFAKINMSHNLFQENSCAKGVINISGMEKELLIQENRIEDNFVHYAVQFNMQSHTDKFGLVPASFYRNIVVRNRDSSVAPKFQYQPSSYAVGLRGVQLVNITRNVIENINLQFELLAGVRTGSTEKSINVGRNWWGSNNVSVIQHRIFDFDDWNGYAMANFSPYLGVADRDGGPLTADLTGLRFDVRKTLGGRIFQSVRLSRRYSPYQVTSDLTIMPNAVVTVDPGVVLEFFPSVGILVLGDLVAEGEMDQPITMRPVQMVDEYRFKRYSVKKKTSKARLCIAEICNENRNDGFLEIFNSTTEQWVPVCDPRFTERNAQVVCTELGFSALNVHLKRGPRLDLGPTQVGRVRSWPHPLECLGSETRLDDCEYRLNGYVDDYRCLYSGDFVYVFCGHEAMEADVDHWGGIRFSIQSFETYYSSMPTISYAVSSSSKLEFVNIEGAGVLHGEKSAAVQLVQREVQMDYVNVTKSASHGVEVIAVAGTLSFNELIVKNNLGIGLNYLSLTGESSDRTNLAFDPLQDVDIPYEVFGMVDMCDINKQMIVENRILLYYKYDNKPVDCVKIFSSLYNVKQIGFRLLQFNLFNGTDFAAQPDRITIYDGDIFNVSSPELARISWQYGIGNVTKFYISSDSTLSVNLHTIGGGGDKGFIAEVVTLPISHPIARDTHWNVSYSEILDNGEEGLAFRSAGEITPVITMKYNRILRNGIELFGNFTAGDSAVLMDIQNAQWLYFYNNLVRANQGGLNIRVDSHASVSSLRGLVVNNLFTENRNRETLVVQGRKSGALQFIDVYRNYFARNYAQYRDTIVFAQVMSNMTQNVAYNNTGSHLLDVQGFEKQPVSYQTCENNWFWKNYATDYWDRSTIVASKAGQRFNFNYLVNPDNDFELTAMNRSVQSELKVAPVNATYNWWGFNGTSAISGRIKDYFDYEELLKVQFDPFLFDNSSVLSGKCAGGWTKIGDTCFLYVGGIMTFAEAKRFCELDNASMPYVKTMHSQLMEFVEHQQFYYHRYSDRIWIQSIDIPLMDCAVLVNAKVIVRSCDEYLPFLCERDPEITVNTRLWFMEPLTIAFVGVVLAALVFVLVCLAFWLCKSRQRYREKLERRNSIRASIRSNRSLTGFSELGYKRRIERAFETTDTVSGRPTQQQQPPLRLNGSVDSIEKAASRFSCSMDDSYENTAGDTSTARIQNGHFPDFVNRYHQDPELENATINMMVHPTFDLTYENQGYIDRSVSRNSHEISRDWSSTTGSTLDMKRSLDQKDTAPPYPGGPYANIPSPHLTSSRESNSRDGASSCSSSRAPPLETAM